MSFENPLLIVQNSALSSSCFLFLHRQAIEHVGLMLQFDKGGFWLL